MNFCGFCVLLKNFWAAESKRELDFWVLLQQRFSKMLLQGCLMLLCLSWLLLMPLIADATNADGMWKPPLPLPPSSPNPLSVSPSSPQHRYFSSHFVSLLAQSGACETDLASLVNSVGVLARIYIWECSKNSAEAKGFSVCAGDALKAVQASLTGSGQAFVTWDITLVTPCTWINVACDSQNNVNYL